MISPSAAYQFPFSSLPASLPLEVTRVSRGTSAKMSCQERYSSLFFSLLLAGEGFAHDCALLEG